MERTTAKPTLRLLAAMLVAMLIAVTAGCNTASPTASFTTPTGTTAATASPAAPTPEVKEYKDKLTVDFFSDIANYEGIQGGWYGKALLDKFNIELNIISPIVSGGGDTLFQTRSAAGNLGDIVNISRTKLSDTTKAGLFMDITDLLQSNGKNYLARYSSAVESIKKFLVTDRVYAIPSTVSTLSPTVPALEGGDPQYATFMRWDLYQEIGSPVMNTLDDLLPALKQMQEKYPASESGKKTYGFSMFKDWDGGFMQQAAMFSFMYGYTFFQSSCFLSGDPNMPITQSLIDDNGIYLKALKLYYKANQMGLVDPDSSSQNWDTLTGKVKDGQVLFSWWSWLGPAYYNTKERSAESKGFAYVPVMDEKLYVDGCNPDGQWGQILAIGIKAKDPARMMDIIDWMASPEGAQFQYAGPEGLSWEMKDGRPTLTEYGKTAAQNNSPVPDEYGGGNFNDGGCQINGGVVLMFDINPNTSEPYDTAMWQSTIESAATNLDKSWQAAMKAKNTIEFTKAHNMLLVAPGNNFLMPADPSDIQTKRAQCGQAITNASWKMIYASDEKEFNSIWEEMKTQVKGLGFDDVFAYDTNIAEGLNIFGNK
jgi:putative aldouronate transport system substrate-binding protein